MRLHGYGISLELPPGWEGRIYRRHGAATLHAGNFALPGHDADYATRALGRMGRDSILLVVTEFDRSQAHRGLFDHRRPRELHRDQFDPRAMQRLVPGLTGHQRFFTDSHRTFCLYAVVADGHGMRARVHELNDVIATLRIVDDS